MKPSPTLYSVVNVCLLEVLVHAAVKAGRVGEITGFFSVLSGRISAKYGPLPR